MYKYLQIFLLSLFYCAFLPPALAKLYLSDFAKMGMESFENDRPKLCFHYSNMVQNLKNYRDGKPILEEDYFEMDYINDSQNIDNIEAYINYYCSINFVTFIESKVHNACPLSQIPRNNFCKAFYETNKGSNKDRKLFFAEEFDDFGNYETNVGWSINKDTYVLSDHYAEARVGLGNVQLRLSITLGEVKKDDPVLDYFNQSDYIYFEMKDMPENGYIYIPVFYIIASPMGLAEEAYLATFETQTQMSEGIERTQFVPIKEINWSDLYIYESFLTQEILDGLFKADRFLFYGKYTHTGDNEPIFMFDMKNTNFREVYDELISIFSTYVSNLENAS